MDREQLAKAFEGYHWKKRQQERMLRESLETDPLARQKLVATYGLDTAMRKARRTNGTSSSVELAAIDKLELEEVARMYRHAEEIAIIESAETMIANLDDDRLLQIYEYVLEGMKDSEIGREMRCHRSTVRIKKEKIIDTIYNNLKVKQN